MSDIWDSLPIFQALESLVPANCNTCSLSQSFKLNLSHYSFDLGCLPTVLSLSKFWELYNFIWNSAPSSQWQASISYHDRFSSRFFLQLKLYIHQWSLLSSQNRSRAHGKHCLLSCSANLLLIAGTPLSSATTHHGLALTLQTLIKNILERLSHMVIFYKFFSQLTDKNNQPTQDICLSFQLSELNFILSNSLVLLHTQGNLETFYPQAKY